MIKVIMFSGSRHNGGATSFSAGVCVQLGTLNEDFTPLARDNV